MQCYCRSGIECGKRHKDCIDYERSGNGISSYQHQAAGLRTIERPRARLCWKRYVADCQDEEFIRRLADAPPSRGTRVPEVGGRPLSLRPRTNQPLFFRSLYPPSHGAALRRLPNASKTFCGLLEGSTKYHSLASYCLAPASFCPAPPRPAARIRNHSGNNLAAPAWRQAAHKASRRCSCCSQRSPPPLSSPQK